jgi:hypothetical protein
MDEVEFFCPFPNPWALRVSGGWVVMTKNVRKIQNHCTLMNAGFPFHDVYFVADHFYLMANIAFVVILPRLK